MKQYKIGKNKTNDIVLSSIDVSGFHAIVTQLSTNVFLIEDKESTNGTFIDGQRIRRTTFTKNDKIAIARTPLDLNLFFKNILRKEPKKEIKKSDNNDYSEEFQKLEIVYKAYAETKNKLQNDQSWLTTGVRVGLSFIPVVGFGLSMLAGNFLKKPEKQAMLNEEFKVHYVCPKCKRFLGNIPFEGLSNMKKHSPPCNAIWVK